MPRRISDRAGALSDLLDLAVRLAREAGAIQRTRLREPRTIDTKSSPIDLVTDVDRACDELILDALARERPGDAVLTEEHGERPGNTGWRWVVDPLDGTVNYAHGVPQFAVSIGVERDGEALVGVVYDPIKEELYTATKGAGAQLNGDRLHTSTTPRLDQALIATGFAYDVHHGHVANLEYFGRLIRLARAIRRPGAAALDLAYVAAGRFDAFWELSLHRWDVSAGALLVREAGGRVTALDGGPIPEACDRVLATNGPLHAAMLDALR